MLRAKRVAVKARHNDKETSIRTRISTSSEKHHEYGPDLLLAMRRQLHLDSLSLLGNLIECPLSREKYIEILRQNGLLRYS